MITNRLDRTLSRLRYILTGLLASVVLLVSAGMAAAQAPSTDRDNPTPLTSTEIKGDGVDEKTEYFYSFIGGPGAVKITLDVKAEPSTAVSSVDIAVFNASARKLLSTYSNPDHGSSKRAVETVNVHGTQTLLLEVDVSTGVASFKIKLDGAVTIKSDGTGSGNNDGTVLQDDASVTPANASIANSSAEVPMFLSQDQSNPTPLETRFIQGAAVNEKTEYFCTFPAGPGKVTLKLNVKSKKEAAVSSVDIELLDSDSKHLVSGFANPSAGGSKQEILSAQLDSKQKVILKITVSTGVDNYSLRVAGAVDVNEAASLRPRFDRGSLTAVALKVMRSQSEERR